MTLPDIILLALAAFFAGGVNAIAGGGSFLTFPALVFTGVPTIAANATSAVAVFPGYLSGALGFLRELRALPVRQTALLMAVAALGGFIGSLLLLVSSPGVFALVIPWLLGFATLLFAFGRHVATWAQRHVDADGWQARAANLIVCIYGGYFNGGLGIVLLAMLAGLGMRDLNQMNGLKNGMSFVVSAASVATFALAGIVVWPQAVLMMVAATLGGYAGARVSRRLPPQVIRAAVVAIGAAMTLVFFLRI
ncbi:sulfite exporter TauE/SafE family protein [Roseovarius dicentrarchi]|uniref:sulfite exporter TauE/SafE family protein n=1 Tax=Roseovarius dicentrarchi TaxID=2250573 RepID=UPI000DE872C1|nr:sulfite exporter TauE/SafE family protein [Roseovarius dicentrarchi]